MASTVKNWYILSKGKKVGPVSELSNLMIPKTSPRKRQHNYTCEDCENWEKGIWQHNQTKNVKWYIG